SQHGLWRDFAKKRDRGLHEGFCVRVLHHHCNPGIGAELACTQRQRCHPARRNLASAPCQRPRQEEYGVRRAQLAEEGNGLGPGGAKIVECPPSSEGPGKTNSLDERMLDESLTDLTVAALDERENTGMKPE